MLKQVIAEGPWGRGRPCLPSATSASSMVARSLRSARRTSTAVSLAM